MEKERNRTKQAVFRLLKTKVGEELMAAVFISPTRETNQFPFWQRISLS